MANGCTSAEGRTKYFRRSRRLGGRADKAIEKLALSIRQLLQCGVLLSIARNLENSDAEQLTTRCRFGDDNNDEKE
jgi:hypothetical protein